MKRNHPPTNDKKKSVDIDLLRLRIRITGYSSDETVKMLQTATHYKILWFVLIFFALVALITVGSGHSLFDLLKVLL